MRRSGIVALIALFALLFGPLYFSVVPSPLADVVGWSRAMSVTAFFALVPIGFAFVILYHIVAPRLFQRDEKLTFELEQ